MATFLDVSGLEHFTNIFVFLFVWIVVFALLAWSRLLGDNKFIQAAVGLLLALFVLMSDPTVRFVSSTSPFIVAILLLVLFLNMALKMLGGEIESMPSVKGIILVTIVFVVLAAVALELRQAQTAKKLSDLSTGPGLFLHPNFLGVVLILAISVFTIAFLTHRAA